MCEDRLHCWVLLGKKSNPIASLSGGFNFWFECKGGSAARSVVCKFENINWEASVSGWVCWLAMLAKESCSEIIADHPNLVSLMVLMCLSSSFITVAIPDSSVTMIGFPSPKGAFQFPIEFGEHVDESVPLFGASLAWQWLLQNVGCWNAVMINDPSGWFFSDMCPCCIAHLAQV